MASLNTSTSSSPGIEVSSKRIEVIDALRGFSLLGIILTHTTYSFLETTGQPTDISDAGSLSTLDNLIKMGVQVLATGKFYSIFSFLFGLSFAIQLRSARNKGVPFVGRFVWRLAILLVIGYIHTMLYPRDVLQIYALLGLVLIFCVDWSKVKLLIGSAVLLVISVLVTVFSAQVEAVVFPPITAANNYAISDVFGVAKFAFLIPSGRMFVTIALFMLGLYAGKRNIFKLTPENNTLHNRLFWWGGIFTVLSTGIIGLVGFAGFGSASGAEVVKIICMAVQKLALSAFFVAAIVKLFQGENFISAALQWLVPVGRIGLTVYVTQSLFMVGFYELFLEPETLSAVGLAFSVVVTLLFYAGQMLFAHWWMVNYRLGPLEWLWRSLTYMKIQPIRKSRNSIIEADTLGGTAVPLK
ncbi:DUF418 domain-containing protein [Pontibacter sp. SGAir0037]|uniref:DUF418 domain-containing protein n=1 Tax=Pontibacter sp. SGAir0037 TaxID=2571030 RepID=UPI0010CD19ED|nr:DUF418 domain-containing protein [Pontibacter sp. SGAir0037]QCR23697.1 hypothetical protein C1N53_15990 [Pontibacter sp. SGAir0037]